MITGLLGELKKISKYLSEDNNLEEIICRFKNFNVQIQEEILKYTHSGKIFDLIFELVILKECQIENICKFLEDEVKNINEKKKSFCKDTETENLYAQQQLERIYIEIKKNLNNRIYSIENKLQPLVRILEKFVLLKLSCSKKENESESIYEHFGFSESSCDEKMSLYLEENNLNINDLTVKKQFLTLDEVPIDYLNDFLKEILDDYSLNLLNFIIEKIRNTDKILTINDFQHLMTQKDSEDNISFSEKEKKIIIEYCLGNLQSLPSSDKKCEVTCQSKTFYRYELACKKILIESEDVYCLYETPPVDNTSEVSTSQFPDDESCDKGEQYDEISEDSTSQLSDDESDNEVQKYKESCQDRETFDKDDDSDDKENEESCQDKETSEEETLSCHEKNEQEDKVSFIFKFKIPFLLLMTMGLLKMPKNLKGITNYCSKFFYRNYC